MIINFVELQMSKVLSLSEKVDYSNRECEDALLERVNFANIDVDAYLVEDSEVHLTINVVYDFDYLDALNLCELHLSFEFEEKVLFTNDQKKAEELDIDYFQEEIDIDELVWNLILVDVPFNYSEARDNSDVMKESDLDDHDTYNPFSEIFKK